MTASVNLTLPLLRVSWLGSHLPRVPQACRGRRSDMVSTKALRALPAPSGEGCAHARRYGQQSPIARTVRANEESRHSHAGAGADTRGAHRWPFARGVSDGVVHWDPHTDAMDRSTEKHNLATATVGHGYVTDHGLKKARPVDASLRPPHPQTWHIIQLVA